MSATFFVGKPSSQLSCVMLESDTFSLMVSTGLKPRGEFGRETIEAEVSPGTLADMEAEYREAMERIKELLRKGT